MPAALIILVADGVINLVRITTVKIRNYLFQNKACVSGVGVQLQRGFDPSSGGGV